MCTPKQKTYPSWHQFLSQNKRQYLLFSCHRHYFLINVKICCLQGIDSLIYINPHTINIEILHYFSTIRTFYHNDHLPENAQTDVVLSSLLQMHDFSTWHYEKAFSISKLLTYRTLPKIYPNETRHHSQLFLPEKLTLSYKQTYTRQV